MDYFTAMQKLDNEKLVTLGRRVMGWTETETDEGTEIDVIFEEDGRVEEMSAMDEQRARLQEMIQEERDKRVTQGELIKKWRDEADLVEKQGKNTSFGNIWAAKDEEKIDVLRKCANQLEAMTY